MTAVSYKIKQNQAGSGGGTGSSPTIPGALGDGYFFFEDTSFVTGDSPATHDINDALGRNAESGYIINTGSGAMTFAISEDGTAFGDEISLAIGEGHDIENDNVDKIRTTWVANTSYKIYAK